MVLHYLLLVLKVLFLLALAAMVVLTAVTAWNYLFGPRVIRALTNKYLFKRRIAWVSLVAVVLCTAMVLVVISVMGGWLRMFRESFHGLSGDVIVSSRSMSGFPHYGQMIREMEALPEVEAAVPLIQTFGLVNINSGQIHDAVQVLGMPIDQIGRVNRFPESLYRQHLMHAEAKQTLEDSDATAEEEERARAVLATPPTTQPSFELVPGVRYDRLLPSRGAETLSWPGMIVGAGVIGIRKDAEGNVDRPDPDVLLGSYAKLAVMGISEDVATFDPAAKTEREYWLVDDSRTQIWQYDSNTIYVPFDVLQRDLGMDAKEWIDPDTNQTTIEPARANEIHVKVRPGHDLNAARDKVEEVVQRVMIVNSGMPRSPPVVETWEQSQAIWLGAVEKEKALVTFLFAMISVVAIFLIFCIFYMIVVEKTRDIGIIKSVGATSAGVAGIFLGYGLAIGLVGSAVGFGVALLIVRNINEIHTWMGRQLGIVMWNPEVYAFDTIPNTMDPGEVVVILAIAILASVVGALVPAMRAARMNPVEALRWE